MQKNSIYGHILSSLCFLAVKKVLILLKVNKYMEHSDSLFPHFVLLQPYSKID